MRDLILEEMTDIDDVKDRCLAAEEQVELARELLEAWMTWYADRDHHLAPFRQTQGFLA